MSDDIPLNVKVTVFIHRDLVQGAGLPVCQELASQRAVVDSGPDQFERPVCAIQHASAIDRRILQCDGFPARGDGTCVFWVLPFSIRFPAFVVMVPSLVRLAKM